MTSTTDRAAQTVMARANVIFNQCFFVNMNVVGEYGGVDRKSSIQRATGCSWQVSTNRV
jgi:hypothetical protein